MLFSGPKYCIMLIFQGKFSDTYYFKESYASFKFFFSNHPLLGRNWMPISRWLSLVLLLGISTYSLGAHWDISQIIKMLKNIIFRTKMLDVMRELSVNTSNLSAPSKMYKDQNHCGHYCGAESNPFTQVFIHSVHFCQVPTQHQTLFWVLRHSRWNPCPQ